MGMDTPSITDYPITFDPWWPGGQKPISAKSLSPISFLFYVSDSDLRVCWGWWFSLWLTTEQKPEAELAEEMGLQQMRGRKQMKPHVQSFCWCERKCKELKKRKGWDKGGGLTGASLCKVRANPDIPTSLAFGWGGCVYCGSGPECAPVPTQSCRNVTVSHMLWGQTQQPYGKKFSFHNVHSLLILETAVFLTWVRPGKKL